MHEVSLVLSAVDQINIEKEKHHFDKVIKIHFLVGKLSGVDINCIEFCFPEVTRGTCLEGAELLFDEQEIQLLCMQCGRESLSSEELNLQCSYCQSKEIKIVSGKEFKIIDLEVED